MHQHSTKFSVVVCKATRAPLIFYSDLPLFDATYHGTKLYEDSQKLNKGGFLVTGTSIMIVDSCYNKQIKQLKVGHLSFFNIKVEAQYGSI